MLYEVITLIIVLASSLFVALVLTPPFIATFMKIEDIARKVDKKKVLRNAGIIFVVSLPFYLLGIFWLANVLVVIALLMLLNLVALRRMARWFQQKFLTWAEGLYEKQLRRALTGKMPLAYFFGTIFLLSYNFV